MKKIIQIFILSLAIISYSKEKRYESEILDVSEIMITRSYDPVIHQFKTNYKAVVELGGIRREIPVKSDTVTKIVILKPLKKLPSQTDQ